MGKDRNLLREKIMLEIGKDLNLIRKIESYALLIILTNPALDSSY